MPNRLPPLNKRLLLRAVYPALIVLLTVPPLAGCGRSGAATSNDPPPQGNAVNAPAGTSQDSEVDRPPAPAGGQTSDRSGDDKPDELHPDGANPVAPDPLASPVDAWRTFRGTAQSLGRSASPLPRNLELLWDVHLPDTAIIGSPVIDRGTVYIVDGDGLVLALDLHSGDEKWRLPLDAFVDASPAIIDDCLVVGDLDGVLYCIDLNERALRWSLPTDTVFLSSVGNYHGDVLALTETGLLMLLSLRDGSEKWRLQIEDRILSAPSINDGYCLLTGCLAQLYVVSLERVALERSIPLDAATGITAAIDGDQAIFSTSEGSVLCIDWRTGEEIWRRSDSAAAQEVASCPAVGRDVVVVGGGNTREILALERDTGDERWIQTSRRMVHASPIIAGELAIIGSHDGRIFGFDLETGDRVLEFECGGVVGNSPAVAEGRVVVAIDQGSIFCLGDPE